MGLGVLGFGFWVLGFWGLGFRGLGFRVPIKGSIGLCPALFLGGRDRVVTRV